VLDTSVHFHPSLTFVSKAMNLTECLTELHCNNRLLLLPANIRLGWKSMAVTNTVVYYVTETIKNKKFYSIGPTWGKSK
jgi:hypothetical protein